MDNDLEIPDINCNYVDINSSNYENKKNTVSLFHLNISSLKIKFCNIIGLLYI